MARRPVSVVADITLPRTVPTGEVDRDTRALSQLSMLSYLASLVVGRGEGLCGRLPQTKLNQSAAQSTLGMT